MSRFYVPKGSVNGNILTITGKEAHHIINVMRLKVPDEVIAFDGAGTEYLGVIKDIGKGSLTIDVIKTRKTPAGIYPKLTLIQSILKKDKMDYVVEKATELGISSIIPVVTQRTIPNWEDKKKAFRIERWGKIAKEASKQCGRADIPSIAEILDLETALEVVKGHDLKLIAALRDDTISMKDALDDTSADHAVIAIGPEGDFTDIEVDKAKDRGFKLVNLGPRVLKSDTAGLAALAVINYEYSR